MSASTPTLDEVRTWPGTVNVAQAASALGISRSQLYALIKAGQSPVGVVPVGARRRVATASLVRVLEGGAP